jgi:competence protein ComEA
VNINLASQRQLEGLPGIGPELAAAIVEYRRVNGAYRRPEDLLKVPGIGERILAKVRPLVTVT